MTRYTRTLVLLLGTTFLSAAPLTFTSDVEAQAEDDALVQMARKRFREGVAYYDQKQYAKARAAFLQAYALKKHPAVLLNLAQSELRSGLEAKAAKHFAQYQVDNAAATPAEKAEAQKGLDAAKLKVHEVMVTAPVGAEVTVDGESVGKAPLGFAVYLLPGKHTLEAKLGSDNAKQELVAVANKSSPVNLQFGGAPPIVGPVTDTAPPPDAPPATDTGSSEAQFSTEGNREPLLKWTMRSPVAWAGLGIVGVGLIGGGVFAIRSSNFYSDADESRDLILAQAAIDSQPPANNPRGDPRLTGAPCNSTLPEYAQACDVWNGQVDDGDSAKKLSTVFLVGGLILGGGTYVGGYFLTAKKTDKPDAARGPKFQVVPVIAKEQRGLVLTGQF